MVFAEDSMFVMWFATFECVVVFLLNWLECMVSSLLQGVEDFMVCEIACLVFL